MKNIKIRLVELNNKTRKGTYLYIKSDKTTGKYYKVKEGDKIDPIVEYYKDKEIKKKPKGTLKQYQKTYQETIEKKKQKTTPLTRKAKRYVKQRPSINKQIKKGIGIGEIKDVHKATTKELHEANKAMLRGLVLDEELLNLLVTKENMKKLVNRIETRITLHANDGGRLATASKFRTLPEQNITQLKKDIRKGEYVGEGTRGPVARKLKQLEYKGIDITSEGKLGRISMTLIFRKGENTKLNP